MEWGREIKVDGKRPGWLGRDIPFHARARDADWYGMITNATPHVWQSGDIGEPLWGENAVDYIRLPADHFAYRALDAGFEPWGGGDQPPEDWDGGEVLLRNGERIVLADYWTHPCKPGWDSRDVIGYRRRQHDIVQHESDTVTVKRMTEDTARQVWRKRLNITKQTISDLHIAILRDFGIIRPPETLAERFARETGHEVTPAVEAALNWGRE